MQESFWTELLGIIIVRLKTNSPNAEPIETPDPRVPVSKKKLSFFQYCIVFPMRSFFKRHWNEGKNICIINIQLSI